MIPKDWTEVDQHRPADIHSITLLDFDTTKFSFLLVTTAKNVNIHVNVSSMIYFSDFSFSSSGVFDNIFTKAKNPLTLFVYYNTTQSLWVISFFQELGQSTSFVCYKISNALECYRLNLWKAMLSDGKGFFNISINFHRKCTKCNF